MSHSDQMINAVSYVSGAIELVTDLGMLALVAIAVVVVIHVASKANGWHNPRPR